MAPPAGLFSACMAEDAEEQQQKEGESVNDSESESAAKLPPGAAGGGAFSGCMDSEPDPEDPRGLKAIFAKYDTNSDGVLNIAEVEALMLGLGFIQPDTAYLQKLAAVFGSADVDHSGGISFAEFPKFWDHLGG